MLNKTKTTYYGIGLDWLIELELKIDTFKLDQSYTCCYIS